MVKPDAAIYQHLLATHGLSVEDTILIDDTPSNVATAEALGMDAILFRSPEQCKRELAHRLRLSPIGE
jgi:FMN phosphatase YigB (HAD superfamily)